LSLKFFDICVFRIICTSIQERPELKLVSHRRKVALIGRPVRAIEGLVVATGLSPLIECSVVTAQSWTYICICGEVAQGDQHLPPSSKRVDDHTR